MVKINMQYFGGNGASSKKSGGGAGVKITRITNNISDEEYSSIAMYMFKQGQTMYKEDVKDAVELYQLLSGKTISYTQIMNRLKSGKSMLPKV